MEALTEHVEILDFSTGEVVITEESYGDTLYIIIEGAVEIVINIDKKNETVLDRLEKNNFFGEMCIIEAAPRSATVRTVENPTKLYALTRADIYRLYKQSPQQFSILILNIARDLSRRLRQLDKLYAAKAY